MLKEQLKAAVVDVVKEVYYFLYIKIFSIIVIMQLFLKNYINTFLFNVYLSNIFKKNIIIKSVFKKRRRLYQRRNYRHLLMKFMSF